VRLLACVRTTVSAVTLAVVAGCTQQPASTAALAPDGRGQPRELSPREDLLLLAAEEALVSRCMAGNALTYTVTIPTQDPPRRISPEPWYGLDDVASARAKGYGLDEGTPRPAPPEPAAPAGDPNARLVERMPPAQQQAYSEALYGRPAERVLERLPSGATLIISVTGCVAEARRRLYGDVRGYLRAEYLVVNIHRPADRAARATSQYRQALDRWRTCMGRLGHGYGEPAAARAAMEARYDRSPRDRAAARAEERTVATADATCGRQSRLVATAKQMYRDALAAQTRALMAEIRTYRAARVRALGTARAAGLLGSVSPNPTSRVTGPSLVH
jgi:hypothetical protein